MSDDPDRDRDRDAPAEGAPASPADKTAPDNGNAVAPAPTKAALLAVTALQTTLNAVDTVSGGRYAGGLPMLTFKREGSGTWMYGQKKTIVEEGSFWAFNPETFKRGGISFDGNKVVGERLLPISLPMPNLAELPDTGFPYQEQWSVNAKCTSGTDAGVEVAYKTTTVGGIQAIKGLIEAVRDQLNGGRHNGNVVPIVTLGKYSYMHGQYGRIWGPELTITRWVPMTGPESAPPPPPPPSSPPDASAAEQPRRRRVG